MPGLAVLRVARAAVRGVMPVAVLRPGRMLMPVAVLRLGRMLVPVALPAMAGAGVGRAGLSLIVARVARLRSGGAPGALLGAFGAARVAPALVQAAVGVALLVEVHTVVRTGLIDRIANGVARQHVRDRCSCEHEPQQDRQRNHYAVDRHQETPRR